MATDLPTVLELAAIAQQKLRSQLDPDGTGAVDLHPGSKNDTLISLLTALGSRLGVHVADRVAARSLATATGDDLKAIANDLYQDQAKEAAASTGFVYLQRTGTAASVIPAGSRFAVPAAGTQPGVIFTSQQDVPVPSSVVSGVAVPVVCSQDGVIGNVQVALITKIVDTLPDNTWSVATPPTNATPLAGGAEAETDDQFRARLQQSAFDDSKKRGTLKAIQTGALQVPGVSNVTVVEPNDGTLLVYVGDSNFQLSSQLASAVSTNLENWRAFGIPCLVRAYNVSTITVVANLYMAKPLNSYNTQAIQAQAVANTIAYFANRPRPDEVFGSAISAALIAAHPEAQSALITSLVSSGASQPDSSQNIKRPTDANSGVVTALPRFITSSASILISILPPQTQ